MKQLIPTLIGLAFLSMGAVSANAQVCTQTIEVEVDNGRFVFESGLALLAQQTISTQLPGEVEVYQKSPASGVFELQQILRAEPVRPGEWWFGSNMSTDGNTIAVSSEYMNFPGEHSALYIFERNEGLQTWEQVAKITPPSSSSSHRFGGQVTVSGDQILIGAPLQGSGRVYVLNRDSVSGLWSYGQTLAAPAGVPALQFGTALDRDGDLLAVGDPLVDNGRGAVQVFERDSQTGMWTFAQSLDGWAMAVDQKFGSSIAIQGNRVLAGAPGYGLGWGNAILWEKDPVSQQWQLGFVFTNAFGIPNSQAGTSVAMEGDDAYIAILGYGLSIGSIKHYRYNPNNSSWSPQGVFIPPYHPAGHVISNVAGNGLGASDGVLAYSARHYDSQTSAMVGARLFFMGVSDQDCDGNGVSDLCEIGNGSGADLNGNGLLDICEDIGISYCRPTALNSVGEKGLLGVDGSLLASENNLTLRATQLPPGQFGYALNSPFQGVVANPGGSQGTLCIFGPSLGRHNRAGEVRYSGAAGEFDLIIDLSSFPSPMGPIMVQAGETWNFQVWYRDQNPGSTSNMTNAVSLTFQ